MLSKRLVGETGFRFVTVRNEAIKDHNSPKLMVKVVKCVKTKDLKD